MSGELTKLKIKAFSNEQFSEEVADGEFRTLLNPETYMFKYKIEQNDDQAPAPAELRRASTGRCPRIWNWNLCLIAPGCSPITVQPGLLPTKPLKTRAGE